MNALSDDAYFSRSVAWHIIDEQVIAHDSSSPKAPRLITMEPWHEIVFMGADGEHTVGQFIAHLATQYDGGAPVDLREQVHEIIALLVEEGILRIHSEPTPLPANLASDSLRQARNRLQDE